jgi:hypothetical protein
VNREAFVNGTGQGKPDIERAIALLREVPIILAASRREGASTTRPAQLQEGDAQPRGPTRREALEGSLVVKARKGVEETWYFRLYMRALTPQRAEEVAIAVRRRAREAGASGAMVVATYVSPRAAEVLARHNIGYVDSSGNCRLVSESFFLERTGTSNAYPETGGLRSLFTPGAERVMRAILDPRFAGRHWTLRDLAAASFPGVSLGQAHKVAKLLEEQAFLHRKGGGLQLHNPANLLDEWRDHYRFKRNRAARFYSPLDLDTLKDRFRSLGPHCGQLGRWGALASFTAASVLAPYVRQPRFFAYWRGERAALDAALELKPVDSGDNVVIYDPYDDGVFYPFEGVADAVTGPLQTYLDVSASPARGEDAAEAIRERYLPSEVAR